jgi:hypothetical protein
MDAAHILVRAPAEGIVAVQRVELTGAGRRGGESDGIDRQPGLTPSRKPQPPDPPCYLCATGPERGPREVRTCSLSH